MIDEAGYSIVEAVLTTGECDRLTDELQRFETARGRAGTRHLMSEPAVAAIANDERLLELARRGLGTSAAVPYRATLFAKSPNANWLVVWHQDTALPLEAPFNAPGWGPWSLKEGVAYAHAPTWALSRVIALRIHLDASTLENGPLRVIPKSHHAGVMADDDVLAAARASAPIDCLVGRGGVLSMRPLLIHSSSKVLNDRPRRVLHIEYASRVELGPGIRLAVA